MDSRPFADAASELRHQFTNLLESLSALRSLIETDTHGIDEHALLDQALQTLAEHQDLERSSVFLLQGKRLVNSTGLARDEFAPGARSRTPTPHAATSFAADEGVMGEALASGGLIHVTNCRSDPRFRSWGDERDEEAGSLIAVPLLEGGQAVGVLNVAHPEPDAFSPWHEHMLQVFGTMLGHMLVNHRLVNALEEHVRHRTAQLEEALAEAESLKTRFEQLSTIDDLTGLHNRRFFFPEATAQLARSLRQGQPLALMVLDLDHFKQVNDHHGHAAGDQVLSDIARYFQSQVRQGDILARMGGEEFVMLLPDTEAPGAGALAERIRAAVQSFAWEDADGDRFGVSVSIGITDFHAEPAANASVDTHRTLDRMLAEADKAVYACKSHGRNRINRYADLGEDF